MFRALNQFIKHHGNDTENDNGSNDHIELEYLRAVDDQIAEAPSRGQKFADDNAHKGKADVDFHAAQDQRYGAWQNYLDKGVSPTAAQRVDQLAHFRVDLTETGVEADDGAEDRYGQTRYDDRIGTGSQPDNEKRGKGGFWQGVQNDEVWFQNFGEAVPIPEQGGGQKT